MKSHLLVYQKNNISFSYPRNTLTKRNLELYINGKVKEEYSPIIQHDPSHYFHLIKDGIYRTDDTNVHTYCSPYHLLRSYYLSENLYFFLMKKIHLNFFQVSNKKVEFIPRSIECVTGLVEESYLSSKDNRDYYRIFIKNQNNPIHLHYSTKVYNENGHSILLMDAIHRLGKRRILGLDVDYEPRIFEIERVQNILESEDFDILDSAFYNIYMRQDENLKLPILMDNILVDLD
jgi:hypothetical protein